ncbi:Chemoreceptor zinc-binding domain-containing protein [Bryocella elongata]|uniref:Chemoreceptor zinc-binding domain-containing protein n=1 Tax=Bryocella elongata TaxID=863522 RepID=A0A1H6AIT3_9BACT|nr:Chemoreceptor zinc-binding domain-containing protein [Bryocella elongata]
MDFRSAVTSHSEWKAKLSGYLSQPNGSLDAATVERDDQCELGLWLHEEGMEWHDLPEYAALTADHAHFHEAAAEVVRRADAGERLNHETVLGCGSAYMDAAKRMVIALIRLKARTEVSQQTPIPLLQNRDSDGSHCHSSSHGEAGSSR